MAMSIHPQGLQMQELLYQQKGALQHPRDRPQLFRLHEPSKQSEALRR